MLSEEKKHADRLGLPATDTMVADTPRDVVRHAKFGVGVVMRYQETAASQLASPRANRACQCPPVAAPRAVSGLIPFSRSASAICFNTRACLS